MVDSAIHLKLRPDKFRCVIIINILKAHGLTEVCHHHGCGFVQELVEIYK